MTSFHGVGAGAGRVTDSGICVKDPNGARCGRMFVVLAGLPIGAARRLQRCLLIGGGGVKHPLSICWSLGVMVLVVVGVTGCDG